MAITAVCLFAAVSAGTVAPAVAPAVVPAAATAAPSAVGATAAAVAAWATALVQVAGSSASVAVPALTFFYAWKHLGFGMVLDAS